MKKVFGKTIATPSWQEAQKLADAKQAKQEAKAAVKISGIDVKVDNGWQDSTVFEAHLSNGKSAIFDMAEISKFEKVDTFEFLNSFSAELYSKINSTHKSISESACDKMLTSHHIDKAEFTDFLIKHIVDDHA